MDGQCHTDDDLKPLNCQRRENLYQPPTLLENSRDSHPWLLAGKERPVAGSARQAGASDEVVTCRGKVEVVSTGHQSHHRGLLLECPQTSAESPGLQLGSLPNCEPEAGGHRCFAREGRGAENPRTPNRQEQRQAGTIVSIIRS